MSRTASGAPGPAKIRRVGVLVLWDFAGPCRISGRIHSAGRMSTTNATQMRYNGNAFALKIGIDWTYRNKKNE